MIPKISFHFTGQTAGLMKLNPLHILGKRSLPVAALFLRMVNLWPAGPTLEFYLAFRPIPKGVTRHI